MTPHALDLFAGTGWGVACQRHRIPETGVDSAPAVNATRLSNGMKNAFPDVWHGLKNPAEVPAHALLIASPPCQTFSTSGTGEGVKALAVILDLIRAGAYKDPATLRELTEGLDDRAALVLAPLAYAYAHRPETIIFEQVPAVLPVWEACAAELEALGYSTATGILSAEEYGVAQARKRAILLASRAGRVELPRPTHGRYRRNQPPAAGLDLAPFVTMFDALGWGFTERPAPTYCNSGNGGAGIEWGSNRVRKAMRAASATGEGWINKPGVEPGTNDAIRVSPNEAGLLQTYPDGFVWACNKTAAYRQIGNAVPPLLAEAVILAALEPLAVADVVPLRRVRADPPAELRFAA